MYSWDSWHTLVPLLLGVVGILAFIVYEIRLSRKAFDAEGESLPGDNIHPIIPVSIFRNWTMRLIYIQIFIHGVVLWSLLYYLPLYYEGVRGYSSLVTGVAVLPETLLIARTLHLNASSRLMLTVEKLSQ
jgi:hypothetical protein